MSQQSHRSTPGAARRGRMGLVAAAALVGAVHAEPPRALPTANDLLKTSAALPPALPVAAAPVPAAVPAPAAGPRLATAPWGEPSAAPNAISAPQPRLPALAPFQPALARRCCLTLLTSRIDVDRQAAIATLASMRDWQACPGAAVALRHVAMHDYLTQMRFDAVRMLAACPADAPIVAEALRTSALFDSEPAIRMLAGQALQRLAFAAPDHFVR